MDSLIKGRWQRPIAFFKDLGFAIGFLVVVIPLAGILAYLLGANNNPALANVTPRTVADLVVFLILAASAGFAEEVSFVDISPGNSLYGRAGFYSELSCKESSSVLPMGFTARRW
jgi:hypothetical protein